MSLGKFSMVALKSCLEINVDVIGAAVDVAVQARPAEDAGAVRDAEAKVGVVQVLAADQVADAEVDARIEGVEQLRLVAPPLREVAVLAEGNALGPGEADAEAEARAHVGVPGKAVVVRLEVGAERPEVRLVAVLEMPLRAEEAG